LKKISVMSVLLLSFSAFALPSADFGLGLNFSGTNAKDIGTTKHTRPKQISLLLSNNFTLFNNLRLSPGFSFEMSGETATTDSGKASYDMMYIRVPIYLKYLIKLNSFGIEPFGGVGVSKVIDGATYFNENETEKQPYFNDYGFDAEVGAAFHYFVNDSFSFIFSPMYSYGLNEVMKDDPNSKLRNIKIRIGLANHNF
jgi:Outer membrane protein beta-barrel domain